MAGSLRVIFARCDGHPNDRMNAISRVDMPRATSRTTPTIFRIGKFVFWHSPGQKDRPSGLPRLVSQQRTTTGAR
tara:strand:- start:699 stop:923 length:225 start_codon:yes stop_codon:yes gene_type:complete